MEKCKVFIDGRVGTTGLAIEERLLARGDVCLSVLPEEQRKSAEARRNELNSADIVFLCLPDEAAKESVSLVENPAVKIIDASTAHRTAGGWTYGFPELSKKLAKELPLAKRVAVPGCHASGFLSLVAPLVVAGLLPSDYPFCCTSITGYSGGGKKMIAEYEAADRPLSFSAPRQYGFLQTHKHLPEMTKYGGLDFPPVFSPVVADFYSGMQVTVPLSVARLNGVKKKDLCDALHSHYDGSKVVSVTALDEAYLSASDMSGRDGMKLFVLGNDERVVLVSLFDNLGKGASGAAVQCMNVMCGLDETTGLTL